MKSLDVSAKLNKSPVPLFGLNARCLKYAGLWLLVLFAFYSVTPGGPFSDVHMDVPERLDKDGSSVTNAAPQEPAAMVLPTDDERRLLVEIGSWRSTRDEAGTSWKLSGVGPEGEALLDRDLRGCVGEDIVNCFPEMKDTPARVLPEIATTTLRTGQSMTVRNVEVVTEEGGPRRCDLHLHKKNAEEVLVVCDFATEPEAHSDTGLKKGKISISSEEALAAQLRAMEVVVDELSERAVQVAE